MGGILVDISIVVALIIASWLSVSAGLKKSLVRLVASASAVGFALVLREPVSWLIDYLLPISGDVAALFAIIVVGVSAFSGMTYLAAWRFDDPPVMEGDFDEYDEYAAIERLSWFSLFSESVAGKISSALAGLVVWVCWASLVLSGMLLVAADGFVFRAANQSFGSGLLLSTASFVPKWMANTFPETLQTLPKGRLGVVVSNKPKNIGVRPDVLDLRKNQKDVRVLFENINEYRASRGIHHLVWNIDIADVSASHATRMLETGYVGAYVKEGASLDERMKSALGTSANRYSDYDAAVAWSQDVGNAFDGLVRNKRARGALLDRHMTEVGIAVVEGGWFNGNMYVVALIGRAGTTTPEELEENVAPGSQQTGPGSDPKKDDPLTSGREVVPR